MRFSSYAAAFAAASVFSLSVHAAEVPLGEEKHIEGMEVASVYLQPITMDMSGHKDEDGDYMLKADESDIHLELDIHAEKGNKHFEEGAWIPYLTVKYTLSKLDKSGKTSHTQSGTFMPMIANDGTHYGKNIKLNGPGKYRASYEVLPPSMNKKIMFGRHTDKETGVSPWFKPFKVEWDFNFVGTGKKGGY